MVFYTLVSHTVGSMGFQQWGRGWREELQLADALTVCFCILKRKNRMEERERLKIWSL